MSSSNKAGKTHQSKEQRLFERLETMRATRRAIVRNVEHSIRHMEQQKAALADSAREGRIARETITALAEKLHNRRAELALIADSSSHAKYRRKKGGGNTDEDSIEYARFRMEAHQRRQRLIEEVSRLESDLEKYQWDAQKADKQYNKIQEKIDHERNYQELQRRQIEDIDDQLAALREETRRNHEHSSRDPRDPPPGGGYGGGGYGGGGHGYSTFFGGSGHGGYPTGGGGGGSSYYDNNDYQTGGRHGYSYRTAPVKACATPTKGRSGSSTITADSTTTSTDKHHQSTTRITTSTTATTAKTARADPATESDIGMKQQQRSAKTTTAAVGSSSKAKQATVITGSSTVLTSRPKTLSLQNAVPARRGTETSRRGFIG